MKEKQKNIYLTHNYRLLIHFSYFKCRWLSRIATIHLADSADYQSLKEVTVIFVVDGDAHALFRCLQYLFLNLN